MGRWWEQLLHNQSALRLKSRLLFTPGVMVTSVPWQLKSSELVADRPEGVAVGAVRKGEPPAEESRTPSSRPSTRRTPTRRPLRDGRRRPRGPAARGRQPCAPSLWSVPPTAGTASPCTTAPRSSSGIPFRARPSTPGHLDPAQGPLRARRRRRRGRGQPPSSSAPCPSRCRCGGCDWQHATLDAQRRIKADIVREAIVGEFAGSPSPESFTVAAVDDPEVEAALTAEGLGWRTRGRYAWTVHGARGSSATARIA